MSLTLSVSAKVDGVCSGTRIIVPHLYQTSKDYLQYHVPQVDSHFSTMTTLVPSAFRNLQFWKRNDSTFFHIGSLLLPFIIRSAIGTDE